MSINNLISYDMMGVKESFADWISNISPYDTPFSSLTGKAPITNKVFEWQTDRLAVVSDNAWADENSYPDPLSITTELKSNVTQILRKTVSISETVEAEDTYGRDSELEFQIEKASREIKRDLEAALLSTQKRSDGETDNIRRMAGFYELTAGIDEAEPTTGAVTHTKVTGDSFTEEDLWKVCEGLYMAGSRANVIMYHPKHAAFFSDLFEKNGAGRVSLYNNKDETVPNTASVICDPWGQEFTLLPNARMDEYMVYFFHPHDWFQRILREPKTFMLDQTGSYETWVIEMELSLQHRNPWASGILEMTYVRPDFKLEINQPDVSLFKGVKDVQLTYKSTPRYPHSVTWESSDTTIAVVSTDGVLSIVGSGPFYLTATGYYARNEMQKSEPISLTSEPVVVTVSKPDYSLVKLDSVDISGSISITPSEIQAAGFTYSVLPNQENATYITVDEKGIVHAIDETPATEPAQIAMTSKFDPSLVTIIEVAVQLKDHGIVIKNNPGSLFVHQEAVVQVQVDPSSTKFTVSPVDGLIFSDITRVDDTHFTFKVTAGDTPSVTGTTYRSSVVVEYADGEGTAPFAISVKDYTVSFTIGRFPTNGAIDTENQVSVHTNEADAGASHVAVWTTSVDGIVEIEKRTTPTKGTFIKYLKPGTVTVTATVDFGGKIGTRSISQEIQSQTAVVTWSPVPANMVLNGTQKLTLNAVYGDLSKATIEYTTTHPEVVKVVGDTLTALKAGSSGIGAKITYGSGYVQTLADHVITVSSITFTIASNTLFNGVYLGQDPFVFTPTTFLFKVFPSNFFGQGRFTFTPVNANASDYVTLQERFNTTKNVYEYVFTPIKESLNPIHYKVSLYGYPTTAQDFYVPVTYLYGAKVVANPAIINNIVTQGYSGNLSISKSTGSAPIKSVAWKTRDPSGQGFTVFSLQDMHGSTGSVTDWIAAIDTRKEKTYNPNTYTLMEEGDYPRLMEVTAEIVFNDNKSVTLTYPITVNYPS